MTTVHRIAPLAMLLAACASAPDTLVAPKIMAGVELAPYAMHEECIALESGARIGYRFRVDPPVAFNIHFREGRAVILPVDIARTTEEYGDLTADRKQVYCLTWEAGAQPAVLDYRVQPLPSRQ